MNTLGSYECKTLREYNQFTEPSHTGNGSEDRRPGDYEGVDEGGSSIICPYGLTYNSDLKRCYGNFIFGELPIDCTWETPTTFQNLSTHI